MDIRLSGVAYIAYTAGKTLRSAHTLARLVPKVKEQYEETRYFLVSITGLVAL